jgi:hypothetical protein
VGADAPQDAGNAADATDGPAACPPLPALVDAGAGPASIAYPDPVYASVGALEARVHTACVDTSALPSHAALDALVPGLLAEVGLKPATSGACACDWSLRFVAQAPALTGAAATALKQAGTSPERYVVVSSDAGGRPVSTLYAASEAAGLYAVRAALGLAVKDATDATARDVAAATVVDWPAIAWRGIVEGMYGGRTSYGTQWTPGERALVMRLLGRLRGNTFVYGPKNDPYAGWIGGSWRTAYPTSSGAAQAIAVAAHDADANLMRFVWAISPGAQFDFTKYASELAAVASKFDSMRKLGVHHFALFLDDQSINATIQQQAQLMNDLDAYVKKSDPTDHLLVVWWDYAGTADSSTSALGPLVGKDVEIMWTGPCVESCTIAASDMKPVDSSYARQTSIWDNWPSATGCCNQSAAERMTGRSADLTTAIAAYYANPVINECGPQCGSAVNVGDFLAHLGPIADYAWDAALYAASTAAVDASYARWGPLLKAWQPLVQQCGATKCTGSGPVYPGWTCDGKNAIWFCDSMENDCATSLPCPGGCNLQPNPNPDICN